MADGPVPAAMRDAGLGKRVEVPLAIAVAFEGILDVVRVVEVAIPLRPTPEVESGAIDVGMNVPRGGLCTPDFSRVLALTNVPFPEAEPDDSVEDVDDASPELSTCGTNGACLE